MIRVEHLTKRYGRTVVVDDVSFGAQPGEALALWGPNGAGKSTIVRCLLGLASFEGTVEIGGLDVRRHGKTTRNLVGYVPQELAFYDGMTVAETVDLSARLRGVGAARVAEVLATVGLGDDPAKKVGALSGGMKQRLGIALALLPDPPVLILDEPTSNLDVAARESMIGLFERLRGERRCLLLTSHHLEEVGMLVERVLAMESGRVTLECEPAELAERLGLRAWLHVILGRDQMDRALVVLGEHGYTARANSRGVLVEVSAGDKGAALGVLQAAGFDVLDLEIWR